MARLPWTGWSKSKSVALPLLSAATILSPGRDGKQFLNTVSTSSIPQATLTSRSKLNVLCAFWRCFMVYCSGRRSAPIWNCLASKVNKWYQSAAFGITLTRWIVLAQTSKCWPKCVHVWKRNPNRYPNSNRRGKKLLGVLTCKNESDHLGW